MTSHEKTCNETSTINDGTMTMNNLLGKQCMTLESQPLGSKTSNTHTQHHQQKYEEGWFIGNKKNFEGKAEENEGRTVSQRVQTKTQSKRQVPSALSCLIFFVHRPTVV